MNQVFEFEMIRTKFENAWQYKMPAPNRCVAHRKKLLTEAETYHYKDYNFNNRPVAGSAVYVSLN